MSRRSFFALGAAAMIGCSTFAVAPAQAHSRPCVITNYNARIYTYTCDGDACWRPVRRGRAFRVVRQEGGHLLVRNLQRRGWISIHAVRFAPQAYCRAAGI